MSQHQMSSMQTALKLVGEALRLDSENYDEAAYKKYLESVSFVATTLLNSQNASRQDHSRLTSAQTNKLIEVAKQCLDRIEILSKKLSEREPNRTDHEKESCSNKLIAVPSLEPCKNDGKDKRNNIPVLESIDWLSPEESNGEITQAAVSPLERAQKENASLVDTYKARLARTNNQAARSNLTLELQRRLAENVQVARAQQEIYLKNIKEEQRKRLDEATKKLAHGDEVNKTEEFRRRREIYVQVLEYENNNKWITKTRKQLDENTENKEIAELTIRRTLRDVNHPIAKLLKKRADQLCDKIRPLLHSAQKQMNLTEEPEQQLGCEPSDYNSDWSRTKDEEFPKDEDYDSSIKEEAFEDSFNRNAREVEMAIASGNVMMSSLKLTVKKQKKSLKTNPLKNLKKLKLRKEEDEEFKMMMEQKERANNKAEERDILQLEIESLERHLETLTCDARQTMDEVVELLLLTFDQLDKGEHRELCHSVVEDYYYFDTTWPLLLQLCRLTKRRDEKLVADAMNRLAKCEPTELGFTKDTPPDFSERYDEAIKLLKQMTTLDIPSKKLNVLVAVARVLCERLESTTEAASKMKSFGADDLIPLLSYVCIRSGVSQLICECHLLEALMDQKYLMGEEGYCLTSLLTSLQYIQTLEMKREQVKLVETTV